MAVSCCCGSLDWQLSLSEQVDSGLMYMNLSEMSMLPQVRRWMQQFLNSEVADSTPTELKPKLAFTVTMTSCLCRAVVVVWIDISLSQSLENKVFEFEFSLSLSLISVLSEWGISPHAGSVSNIALAKSFKSVHHCSLCWELPVHNIPGTRFQVFVVCCCCFISKSQPPWKVLTYILNALKIYNSLGQRKDDILSDA